MEAPWCVRTQGWESWGGGRESLREEPSAPVSGSPEPQILNVLVKSFLPEVFLCLGTILRSMAHPRIQLGHAFHAIDGKLRPERGSYLLRATGAGERECRKQIG